ncbi:MAG: DnaA regulatory inactivator Hda [Candidatus Competibacterales bacterium]|nr:DnaA regulatory inactivator Hda [Candidatus Competibacterales bacterium]
MTQQLPLQIGLRDSAVFASFVAGANAEVVEYLRHQLGDGDPVVFLCGASGCGKSHLLQALCHDAGSRGAAAVYLPLRRADEFPCEALNGLEAMAVVCLDDIDAIAGRADWEWALLRLFERIHQAGRTLVATAAVPPGQLGLGQPQLTSRLSWGLTFPLRPLAEAGRREALEVRARRRGLSLAPEAARYLVRRYEDDNAGLFEALERLDRASLAAKRRLTIPFIRGVLSPDT